MDILPLDPNNKKRVDDFLRSPFSIYKNIPQWVPPLQMDERLRLSRKQFPFYKHSRAVLFSRLRGSGPIGRLAALDNRRYKHAGVMQIGVENENMQREMVNFGIQFYKTPRVYGHNL
jgi:hypothetical protein